MWVFQAVLNRGHVGEFHDVALNSFGLVANEACPSFRSCVCMCSWSTFYAVIALSFWIKLRLIPLLLLLLMCLTCCGSSANRFHWGCCCVTAVIVVDLVWWWCVWPVSNKELTTLCSPCYIFSLSLALLVTPLPIGIEFEDQRRQYFPSSSTSRKEKTSCSVETFACFLVLLLFPYSSCCRCYSLLLTVIPRVALSKKNIVPSSWLCHPRMTWA